MGSGASLNCRSRDGYATVDLHPKQGGTSIQVPDGTALRLRGERDGSWLVEYMGREYFVKKHNTSATAVLIIVMGIALCYCTLGRKAHRWMYRMVRMSLSKDRLETSSSSCTMELSVW